METSSKLWISELEIGERSECETKEMTEENEEEMGIEID